MLSLRQAKIRQRVNEEIERLERVERWLKEIELDTVNEVQFPVEKT